MIDANDIVEAYQLVGSKVHIDDDETNWFICTGLYTDIDRIRFEISWMENGKLDYQYIEQWRVKSK